MSYFVQPVRARRPESGPNATQANLQAAQDLFQQFHCFPAAHRFTMRTTRLMPKVMVALGELRGLIYRSDRGQQGRKRTFIHFMENPTWLACDPAGRQLFILGGKYRVTPQGIEG